MRADHIFIRALASSSRLLIPPEPTDIVGEGGDEEEEVEVARVSLEVDRVSGAVPLR
jgi:hypothetical protein